MDRRRALGQAAEVTAAAFLERRGLVIVARNVRLPGGEIDLVCRHGDRWTFVEVKCRHARWGEAPSAAISWQKRRRLVRLAQHYLKWRGLTAAPCRFDVVTVTMRDDGGCEIRHIPAAFDASGLT